MSQNFAHRLLASILMLALAVVIAPAAIAQGGVMVNGDLVMDDDMLTMLDTDSNRLLSSAEYSFFRDRLFGQSDTNHDGSISAVEHAHHAGEIFAGMDTDHDGFFTMDEIKSGHMNMLRMMYKNPHAPSLGAQDDAMLSHMDIDHDSRISSQEYTDAMKARFDEMDSSHDGAVSKKEFEAVHRVHKG